MDCCADLNSRDSLSFLTETVAKVNAIYLELQCKIKGIEDLIKVRNVSVLSGCADG